MDYTMTPEEIKKMEDILAMNEIDFDDFMGVIQDAIDTAEAERTKYTPGEKLILSRHGFEQKQQRIREAEEWRKEKEIRDRIRANSLP
jgi:3-dehydroquinate dehydratase